MGVVIPASRIIHSPGPRQVVPPIEAAGQARHGETSSSVVTQGYSQCSLFDLNESLRRIRSCRWNERSAARCCRSAADCFRFSC
jgi:hypothetical protein